MSSRTRAVTWALAGAILFSLASGVAIASFDSRDPHGTTVVVLVFGSFGVILLATLAGLITNIVLLASPRSRRPARFTVRGEAFRIPPSGDVRLNGLMGVLLAGPLVGTMWHSHEMRGIAVLYVVITVLLGAAIVALGPGPTFELRPASTGTRGSSTVTFPGRRSPRADRTGPAFRTPGCR
jgi:hypothetical protein